jgi:hypothetical protein
MGKYKFNVEDDEDDNKSFFDAFDNYMKSGEMPDKSLYVENTDFQSALFEIPMELHRQDLSETYKKYLTSQYMK